MPTPNENLLNLHKNISARDPKFTMPYDAFEAKMQDEGNRKSLYKNLSQRDPDFKMEYEDFTAKMGYGVDNGVYNTGEKPNTESGFWAAQGNAWISKGRSLQYGLADQIHNLSDEKIKEDIFKFAKAGIIPLQSENPADYDNVIQKTQEQISDLQKAREPIMSEVENKKRKEIQAYKDAPGTFRSLFLGKPGILKEDLYSDPEITAIDKQIKELNDITKAALTARGILVTQGQFAVKKAASDAHYGDENEWGERTMKKAADVMRNLPEPVGFMGKAGSMVPDIAGSAVGAITAIYNAPAGAAIIKLNMATMAAQSYGSTLFQIDEYAKETGKEIDEDTRQMVAIGGALVEGITEYVRIPGITAPMKKMSGQMAKRLFLKEAIKNPTLAVDMVKGFVGKNTTLAKRLAAGLWDIVKLSNRQGLEEAAEEAVSSIGQDFLSYAYLNPEDTPGFSEMLSNATNAAKMAYMTGPVFGSINKYGKYRNVRQARQSNGFVTLIADNKGNTFEGLYEKDNGDYVAADINGSEKTIKADEVGEISRFGTRDFERLTAMAKKGQEASAELYANAELDLEHKAIESQIKAKLYQGQEQHQLMVNGVEQENAQVIITVETIDGNQYQVIDGFVNKPEPSAPIIGIDLKTGEKTIISPIDISKTDVVPADQMRAELRAEAQNRIKSKYQLQTIAAQIQDEFQPGDIVTFNGQEAEIVDVTDPTQGVSIKITDAKGGEQVFTIAPDQLGALQNPDQGSQNPDQPTHTQTFTVGKKKFNYTESEDGVIFIEFEGGKDESKAIIAEVDDTKYDVKTISEEVPIPDAPPFAKVKTRTVAKGLQITPKAAKKPIELPSSKPAAASTEIKFNSPVNTPNGQGILKERIQGTDIYNVEMQSGGIKTFRMEQLNQVTTNEQGTAVTQEANQPIHPATEQVTNQPTQGAETAVQPSAEPVGSGTAEVATPILEGKDDLFDEAVRIVTETQDGSISNLQRKLRIGYNRVGKIMDQLEKAGIVRLVEGTTKREVVQKSTNPEVTNQEVEKPASEKASEAASDIEAKKADIEARRKEELNLLLPDSKENLRLLKLSKKYGSTFGEIQDFLYKRGEKTWTEEDRNIYYLNEKYSLNNAKEDWDIPIDEIINEEQASIDKYLSSKRGDNVPSEINAKYDAELAALNQPANEQDIQGQPEVEGVRQEEAQAPQAATSEVTQEGAGKGVVKTQQELESDVQSLKDAIIALRDKDGNIPPDKMEEFNSLKSQLYKAKDKAQRGNTHEDELITIKRFPEGEDTATTDPEIITGKALEAAIDDIESIISSSSSADEAMNSIRRAGYVFDYNLLNKLRLYLNDRFDNDAPEVGNNKQSFRAWRIGKFDSDIVKEQATTPTNDITPASQAPASPDVNNLVAGENGEIKSEIDTALDEFLNAHKKETGEDVRLRVQEDIDNAMEQFSKARTNKEHKAAIEAIVKIFADNGLAIPISVHEDAESAIAAYEKLPTTSPLNAQRVADGFRNNNANAFYDQKSGTIFICVSNTTSFKVAVKTIVHESCHNGTQKSGKQSLISLFEKVGLKIISKFVPKWYISRFSGDASGKAELSDELVSYITEKLSADKEFLSAFITGQDLSSFVGDYLSQFKDIPSNVILEISNTINKTLTNIDNNGSRKQNPNGKFPLFRSSDTGRQNGGGSNNNVNGEISATPSNRGSVKNGREVEQGYGGSQSQRDVRFSVEEDQAESLSSGIKLVNAYIKSGVYKFSDIVNSLASKGIKISDGLLMSLKKAYASIIVSQDIDGIDNINTVKNYKVEIPPFNTKQPEIKEVAEPKQPTTAGAKMEQILDADLKAKAEQAKAKAEKQALADKKSERARRAAENKAKRESLNLEQGDDAYTAYLKAIESGDVTEEALSNMTDHDYIMRFSSNPLEILNAINKIDHYIPEDQLDKVEAAIAAHMTKVPPASAARFGDRNAFAMNMARSYFAKKGETSLTLDQIAQLASGVFGDYSSEAVTPDDVWNFILKYPNGVNSFYKQINPEYKELKYKFYDLTGVDISSTIFERAKQIMAEKDQASPIPTIEDFLGMPPEDMIKLEKEYEDFINENQANDERSKDEGETGEVHGPGTTGIRDGLPEEGRKTIRKPVQEEKPGEPTKGKPTRAEQIKAQKEVIRKLEKELSKANNNLSSLRESLRKYDNVGQIDMLSNVIEGADRLDFGEKQQERAEMVAKIKAAEKEVKAISDKILSEHNALEGIGQIKADIPESSVATTNEEYKYRLLLRPFDIGTYPKDGFLRFEKPQEGGFGTIVMDRKLPINEWNKWDLLPVTDIEGIKNNTFIDKDGYYSKIELAWTPDGRFAEITSTDQNGEMPERPYLMNAKDVLTNLEEGYWIEKPDEFEVIKPEVKTAGEKLEQILSKDKEQLPKAPAKPKTYGKSNKIFTEDAAAKAREALKKKFGNLNVGIDPETMINGMTLAGYHIEAGARKFTDFAAAMIEDAGNGIKPYLKSFYEGIRNWPGFDTKDLDSADYVRTFDVENFNTQDNVSDRPGSGKQDSPNAEYEISANEGAVSDDRSKSGQVGDGTKEGDRNSDGRHGGKSGSGLFASLFGEQGNNDVHPANQGPVIENNDAGDFDGRGSDIGSPEGYIDNNSKAGEDGNTDNERISSSFQERTRQRVIQQKKVESVPVQLMDEANIRESLPVLLPEQQDDVLKAEKRFFGDQHKNKALANGKGMLFTNGTGTGKTFTALGVIKRFAKQGKTNILIVVPSEAKINDWIKDAELLGLSVNALINTKDKGEGINITTYATFRTNENLKNRDLDLVVYDESHRIMDEKKGTASSTTFTHYQMANTSVKNAFDRITSVHPLWIEAGELNSKISKEIKLMNNPDLMDWDYAQRREQVDKWENRLKEIAKEQAQLTPSLTQRAEKAYENTKVVFLSATPFKGHFNLRYAKGSLFNWDEETTVNNRGSRVDGESRFFLENFGSAYEWKYHRLQVKENSNAEAIAMQEVEFAEKLMRQGVMSGRAIESDKDYSREFPLVALEYSEVINRAYNDIYNHETKEFDMLVGPTQEVFGDYQYKTRLFESLKASMLIPRIEKHLAMGRKVVVFHRRKQANVEPPFALILRTTKINATGVLMDKSATEKQKSEAALALQQVDAFEDKYSDLLAYEQTLNYSSAIDQIIGKFGADRVVQINGDISKKDKPANIEKFNDDNSGVDVIVIQEEAGKEGISLHDTSGEHQRVLMSLSLPISSTTALQIEGRIFRIGQETDAIFENPLLGLDMEVAAFGQTINKKLSTTENLAIGNQARDLLRSFAEGVLFNSSQDDPNANQGRGGKEYDKKAQETLSEFRKAVLVYNTNQKTTGKRDQREGVDYFATPEPVGQKMVEWLNINEGESVLEPSAGHGAIAMWFPANSAATVVEPSYSLFSKLTARAGGGTRKLINDIV